MKDCNGVEVKVGDVLATKGSRRNLTGHVVSEIEDDKGVRFFEHEKIWIPPLYLARYWTVVSDKPPIVKDDKSTISAVTEIKLCDVSGKCWTFDRRLADLITLADVTGSIRKATLIMGIAYSYAWTRLKNAEECLDFAFFVREGPRGSYLTDEGREFLNHYEKICFEVASLGDRLTGECFAGFPRFI